MRECFGPRFVRLEDEGSRAEAVLTATELSRLLEANPEAVALSGRLRYPKASIPNVIVFDLCFLEDPLDRLWSAYQRERLLDTGAVAGDGWDQAAMSEDAHIYFGRLLENTPELINDVQVRLLAGSGEYTRPPSRADLEAACAVLPRISVLGVADLFEESALTGEHFLQPTFPALQFHCAGRDFAPLRQRSRHENDFRNSVGDAIYLGIKRLNELDLELVAAARREVLRRFAMVPNADTLRARFRERRRAFESFAGANQTAAGPKRDPGEGAANRPVLLHYHIFKNAGSTIEYILDRAFGEKLASVHGPDPDSFLDVAAIRSYLEAHPELAAVTSHHFLYPKPTIPGVAVFDLCFFRDPMKRLWSMYKYLRRAEPVDELGHASKTMDARAFFELLINEHPQVVNSFQVNLLANGGRYTHPLTELDLQAALRMLRPISVLGVVGLFDRSVVAAEYFLQGCFPSLRFDYVKVNADPAADHGRRPKNDEFRRRVGEEVYWRLERLNELDSALVAAARREVLRRWSLVPNRDVRLADFQRRCRALREADAEEATLGEGDEGQDAPPLVAAGAAGEAELAEARGRA